MIIIKQLNEKDVISISLCLKYLEDGTTEDNIRCNIKVDLHDNILYRV